MSGTAGAGPVTGEIDLNAEQLLENLQMAFLLGYRGEAPKWAVMADVVYMGLGVTGTGESGHAVAELDVDQWLVEGTGSRRFSPVFEAFAGLRYTSLGLAVELRTDRGRTTEKGSVDWVDPIVGARLAFPFSEKSRPWSRGGIGGFGVGCDFTWDANAKINWQVSKTFGVALGYRFIDQDYDEGAGGVKWDMLVQGPYLAASATF